MRGKQSSLSFSARGEQGELHCDGHGELQGGGQQLFPPSCFGFDKITFSEHVSPHCNDTSITSPPIFFMSRLSMYKRPLLKSREKKPCL